MSNYFEYTYTLENDVDLVCEFYYTPPEKGSREGGQQMEPDYDESVELICAKVNGADITEILHDTLINSISEEALEEYAKECQEADDDAAIESWEYRRSYEWESNYER